MWHGLSWSTVNAIAEYADRILKNVASLLIFLAYIFVVRDADGAILVYDITDCDSFTKVKTWVKELRKMLGPENISLAIVGNKIDLEKQRHVNAQEAQEYVYSLYFIQILLPSGLHM